MFNTITEGSAYIIAEAGVNHNGSLERALELVDAAAAANADAVKFQSFTASKLVTRSAQKANYQKVTTDAEESQFEMIRKLELSEADYRKIIARAVEKKIDFLSTPFDVDNLKLLIDEFGVDTIKVSSGDLTNAPLLLEIARRAKSVIISTGMATLAEVEAALGVLAFGFLNCAEASPNLVDFENAYVSAEGQLQLKKRVAVLHCSTEYPARVEEVNLRAIDTIRNAFGLKTGYSDHTEGFHVSVTAVALGAEVIEKHFTLNRNLPGPDHKASLEPSELAEMIRQIREIELCLGDGIKRPSKTELANRMAARKSLVAAHDIEKGDVLKLACKRPGSGRSPFQFWELEGTVATKDYLEDDPV